MSQNAFWAWFSNHAPQIAANPEDNQLIHELDTEVAKAWPHLAWEIGPDPSGDWYFALSPNLNRELATAAREAIRAAPTIDGWKLRPTRPPKAWDGRFELDTREGIQQFDISDWQYVFLRYPNAETELVLISAAANRLNEDDRWHAAAIVLESILGEECLLDKVDRFALEPAIDAKLASQAKPVAVLPKAFHVQ